MASESRQQFMPIKGMATYFSRWQRKAIHKQRAIRVSNVQRGQIRFDGKLLAKSHSSFRMSNGDRFNLTQTIRKERLAAKERPESESMDTGPGWKSCRQKESVISQGSTLFLQDIFFRKTGFLMSWGF